VGTFIERTATRILEGIGTRLWGFAPRLMATIVAEKGAGPALGWFVQNMPRYERTLAAFGPIRTHILCAYVSLLRGCPYCTFGHALALELHYLKERDRLFPLDEQAIVALARLDPGVARQRLGAVLEEAALGEECAFLDRMKAALDGKIERPEGDDARIVHLVEMFAVLNACGIKGDVEPDEAHDPINKDKALKERYAAMRANAARAPSVGAARAG
jgi:hypothetical protein